MRLKTKITYSVIIAIFLILILETFALAEDFLTEEEKIYIDGLPVLRAASIYGAAPINFLDSKGEVQGISKRVLDEISRITGLSFECKLYNSVSDVLNSDSDIIFGLPPNYAPQNMKLTQPYLKSETIFFINSSIDLNNFDNKIYAAVYGSELPEGIKEENAIYYNNREDSLNAVESCEADYGYGNAYSVAYYTIRNNYKNILTIPREKESREYCMGLLNYDETLFSILNKSIESIDETHMQTLILDVASNIERNVTIDMVMDAYGKEIFTVSAIVIIILLLSVILNIQSNIRLKIQNKRYEVLSLISNEYHYEYYTKNNILKLSEKCSKLFETKESLDKADKVLRAFLNSGNIDDNNAIIKLTLPSGEIGVFKSVNTRIIDAQGRTESIIGKLIDVSDELKEKEELIIKSQIDELTGLYNAGTTKEYIVNRIKNKGKTSTDAFILIDCDDFKEINDTYGHLTGDKLLSKLGEILKNTFRTTDIIGRIGGDEFCVYLKDIKSVSAVKDKCSKINTKLKQATKDKMSVSIGITLVDNKEPYESLFKKADAALYKAKRNGKARFVNG